MWQPKDIKAELVKLSTAIRDQYMVSKDARGLTQACTKQASDLQMNEAQTRRLCEFVNAQVAMGLEKAGAAGAYPVVDPAEVLASVIKTASAGRPAAPGHVYGILHPSEAYTKTASSRVEINHREFGFDFDDSQEAASHRIKLASIELPAPPPDEAELRSIAARMSYKAADANRAYEDALVDFDSSTRGYTSCINSLAYQLRERRAEITELVKQATTMYPQLGLRICADVLDELGAPCPPIAHVKTSGLVEDHDINPYISACARAYDRVVECKLAADRARESYMSAVEDVARATEVL